MRTSLVMKLVLVCSVSHSVLWRKPRTNLLPLCQTRPSIQTLHVSTTNEPPTYTVSTSRNAALPLSPDAASMP